jgi:hypothetical protein
MQNHRRWMGLCTELLIIICATLPACEVLLSHNRQSSPQLPHCSSNRTITIWNQTRSANMSDQSSSDNISSVAASSSRSVTPPSRPAQIRGQSYTHVFPASSTVSKPRKPITRKADLPCVAAPMQIQDENTRLLFGGLQWLLDASVQTKDTNKTHSVIRESSEPLSEKAITSFNARKHESHVTSADSATTAAWIDGQRKAPAAQPF